jgi:hypothetical protein
VYRAGKGRRADQENPCPSQMAGQSFESMGGAPDQKAKRFQHRLCPSSGKFACNVESHPTLHVWQSVALTFLPTRLEMPTDKDISSQP